MCPPYSEIDISRIMFLFFPILSPLPLPLFPPLLFPFVPPLSLHFCSLTVPSLSLSCHSCPVFIPLLSPFGQDCLVRKICYLSDVGQAPVDAHLLHVQTKVRQGLCYLVSVFWGAVRKSKASRSGSQDLLYWCVPFVRRLPVLSTSGLWCP